MVGRDGEEERGGGGEERGGFYFNFALSTRQSLPMMLMRGGEIAGV